MRYLPYDPVRPVAVYFVYLVLLAGWGSAIFNRVTQGNMRFFLLAEHTVMLVGITSRFIQDALLYHDIYLMRVSGYWIVIPTALFTLFGFYAALGLGKAEEYRIDRKWYYLLIPAGILIFLMLTNERHHLVFRLLEGEVQPNLNFHPNIGVYVLISWAFLLLLARVFLIWRRSRELEDYPGLKNAPFLIAVIMLIFTILYQSSSFVVKYELIEYSALLYFLEVLVWESCIMAGMVPVNTHYEDVFDRSTVAMQIMTEDGEPYLKSASAFDLTPQMLDMLKRQTTFRTLKGRELHLQKIRGGYAVWQSDVSRTMAVIAELRMSAKELEHEGELLRQELKIRSDEIKVREQNRIYNQLTVEIGEQLLLLRSLLEKQETAEDKDELFKKICLIGTYIKRRCNLRLVEQSDGSITSNELELCYFELAGVLRQMGVESDVLWLAENNPDPEFAIFSVDLCQLLLEYESFELQSIKVAFETDTAFSIEICCNGDRGDCSERIPSGELQRINKENYNVGWQALNKGYRVSVSNGRC